MPTAAEIFQMMGKSPYAPWNIFGTIDQGLRSLNSIPQGQNEPDVIYRARQLTGPVKIEDDIRKGVEHYLQSPATRAAALKAKPKTPAANRVFDSSIEGLTEGLINRGIPGHVARGVAGGILAESNGDPNAFNSAGGGQGAYGLSQWRGPRQAALKARYGERPTPEQQLDFLAHELKGGDQGGAAVMAARTPQEALTTFVDSFLRPGEGRYGDLKRGALAMGLDANEVLGQTLTNPFDLRYANQALGQINQAHQAALTPQTLPFQAGPMPEAPQPKPVPKTDFSASESRLEALRPVEWTMKEAENTRWANFWGMLGKAMMSSPEGEGLGSFFLRLGGGALASVGMTRDEVQRRKDLYDDKMAKWNAALYEHDFQKAQVMQNELMADWQQDQNWAMEKYKSGMEVWRQTAIPSVVGNNLVSTHLDPATGKGTVTTTPIKSLVDAAYAMERSNVLMQTFGTENSANAQVAGVANRVQGNIVLAQAGQVLADQNASPQEKAAAAAFGPIRAINYAIDTGQIAGLLGEEETANLNEDIMKTLSGQGVFPGQKGYEEAYRNAATGRLLAYTMQSPETLERLMSTMAPAADLFDSYQRYSNRTERSITDSRGRSSHQITEEAPE